MFVLLCCLMCVPLACDRKTASQGAGQIPEQVVLLLEDSSQNNSAELTIIARSRGIEWSIVNRDRTTKTDTLLRKGTQSTGNLESIRAELKTALRKYSGSSKHGLYSLHLTCLDEKGAWAMSSFSDDRLLWDQVLPRGGPFEVIWREATGIPKTYWYRDVGPFDGTNREVAHPDKNPG